MGDMPKKGQKAGDKAEDPIKKILKSQAEAAAKATESAPMMKTGDGGQVVFDPATETGHVKTPAAVPRAEPTSNADAASEGVPAVDTEGAPKEETPSARTPEAEPAVVEAEASTQTETVASKPAPTAAAEEVEVSEGHVKDEL